MHLHQCHRQPLNSSVGVRIRKWAPAALPYVWPVGKKCPAPLRALIFGACLGTVERALRQAGMSCHTHVEAQVGSHLPVSLSPPQFSSLSHRIALPPLSLFVANSPTRVGTQDGSLPLPALFLHCHNSFGRRPRQSPSHLALKFGRFSNC